MTTTTETKAPHVPAADAKPKPDALAVVDHGVGFDSASGFALLQRGASLLSASSLVPKDYQGNLPNCVIALNMASRMGADPLMVMQNLYVVHGRPGWSAQFLIATFNQNGRFSAIRYEWKGEPGDDAWGCRALAIEKETGEKLAGSWITWKLVKAEKWNERNGSKWLTMPEQMFMYRSAAWFIRAYAPEIAMGLRTAEEHEDDIIDVTPSEPRVVVAQPDTLGGPKVADVVAGAATGEDVKDEATSNEPRVETTSEPLRATVAATSPPAEEGVIKMRLDEIKREAEARTVKPAILEMLYRKHLGTIIISEFPSTTDTWAKLGKVLQEVRSIQAPGRK